MKISASQTGQNKTGTKMAYSQPNNYSIHEVHNDQEVIIYHRGDRLNDFFVPPCGLGLPI